MVGSLPRKFGRSPLPVVVLNSPAAVSDPALGGSNPSFGTARDVVDIVLWALGLAIETVSDAQKVCPPLVSLCCLRSQVQVEANESSPSFLQKKI